MLLYLTSGRHISNLAAAVGRESGSAGDGKSLIWLDTLCCPVQPEEAYKRALVQVRRTYEQATHVLVLDTSLQPYDNRSLGEVEKCTRIPTSRWMRRLWTLQEGSFAKQLWFQFQDRAIELRVINSALYKISATEIGRKGLVLDLLINANGLVTKNHQIESQARAKAFCSKGLSLGASIPVDSN